MTGQRRRIGWTEEDWVDRGGLGGGVVVGWSAQRGGAGASSQEHRNKPSNKPSSLCIQTHKYSNT